MAARRRSDRADGGYIDASAMKHLLRVMEFEGEALMNLARKAAQTVPDGVFTVDEADLVLQTLYAEAEMQGEAKHFGTHAALPKGNWWGGRPRRQRRGTNGART